MIVPEYPEIIKEMTKLARERDVRFAKAEGRMRQYVSAKYTDLVTIFDETE